MNTQYRCGDDVWVNLSASDQRLWPRFCEAVERPDLADDERFATPVDRFKNGPELIGILDEVFAARPYQDWAPRLDRSGVVWAKVATLPDLVDDRAARAMGMYAEVDHPVVGRFETLAAPFTMTATPPAVRGPGPDVGQHTAEVLREAGVDEQRIQALADAGVIALG